MSTAPTWLAAYRVNRKAAALVLPFNASSATRSSIASKMVILRALAPSRTSDFAIQKSAQNYCFILRAFRPPPRLPALPRLELMCPRGPAIADLVRSTISATTLRDLEMLVVVPWWCSFQLPTFRCGSCSSHLVKCPVCARQHRISLREMLPPPDRGIDIKGIHED